MAPVGALSWNYDDPYKRERNAFMAPKAAPRAGHERCLGHQLLLLGPPPARGMEHCRSADSWTRSQRRHSRRQYLLSLDSRWESRLDFGRSSSRTLGDETFFGDGMAKFAYARKWVELGRIHVIEDWILNQNRLRKQKSQ